MRFVSVRGVHPHNSIDKATDLKKSRFISSDIYIIHIIINQSIRVYTFARRILTWLSVDDILLPRYEHLSTNSRSLPLNDNKRKYFKRCCRKHSSDITFVLIKSLKVFCHFLMKFRKNYDIVQLTDGHNNDNSDNNTIMQRLHLSTFWYAPKTGIYQTEYNYYRQLFGLFSVHEDKAVLSDWHF